MKKDIGVKSRKITQSEASKLLSTPKTSAAVKSVAGSALTEVSNKPKTSKKSIAFSKSTSNARLEQTVKKHSDVFIRLRDK
jgi:hypothetical protein